MNYKIHLVKGWNLKSFCSIDIILNDIKNNNNIIEIKSSDGKVYNKKLDDYFNTLKKLKIGEAYWIKSESDVTFDFEINLYRDNIIFDLKKGWNLVGYPYYSETKLENIPSEISQIKTNTKSYNSFLDNEMNNLKKLEKDSGLWIKCLDDLKWELFYPSKYYILPDSKELFGTFFIDNKNRNKLNQFEKLNYIVDSSYYNVSYSGFSDKFENLENEINDILESIFRNKFTIFFEKDKYVGVDFIDKFQVFSFFTGELELVESIYENFLEFRFNRKETERFMIDLSSDRLIFNCDGFNIFINLKFINFVEETNEDSDSKYLYDYNFDDINIKKLIFQQNGIPIEIFSIEKLYFSDSKKMIINLNSEDGDIKVSLLKHDKIDKTIETKIIVNEVEIISKNIIIVGDTSSKLIGQNFYIDLLMDWSGDLITNDILYLSKFTENSEYMYWYDFESLIFNEFYVSYSNYNYALDLEINERAKDYIVFKLDLLFDNLTFILIKDSKTKGNINVYCKSFFNNDLIKWPIHKGKEFKINQNLKVKINWSGNLDKTGYTLKNTLPYEQRELGLKLNTYEVFTFENFTAKVHYNIGNTKDSINLKVWKSYKNFLDILYEIIKYTVDFANDYNLKFPQSEYQIIKNGGSSDYDIYVLDLGSSSIKGYTAGDDFAKHTENERDVITYMTLSNDLDLVWLKTVFYHEFFHSIQGSYDWFDLKWISEGIAVAFEYNLSEYSYLSPKYFLSEIISTRNLSLSYEDNFSFYNNQLEVLFNERLNNDSLFVINVDSIFTDLGSINIKYLDLDDVSVISSNKNFKLVKKKKTEVNGSNILKLYFEFKDYEKTFLYIFVNGRAVISTKYAHAGRFYGTFIFFQYLFEQYNMKSIVSNLMDYTVNYDNFELLEKTIKNVNPESTFMTEVTNFWIAVELLNNDYNEIPEKYKFSKADQWKKYIKDVSYHNLEISSSKNSILIDDLEYTGCSVINLNFSSSNSFILDFNEDLFLENMYCAFVVNYSQNKIDVRNAGKVNNPIKINLNDNVNSIKMIIVADKNFPSNKDIIINSIEGTKDIADQNIFDFYIRVTKN